MLNRAFTHLSDSKRSVAVNDLTVLYGHTPVVKDASLEVGAGEVLGIVGESGSGKTTLCKAIAGILPADALASGSIAINGAGTVRTRSSPCVGYVFQTPDTALNPCVRIGTQLTERMRSRGVAGVEAFNRASAMLDRMRIPDIARMMRRYPHEISGGQQQRVCIAIALLNDPDVLVFDEPTTALDVTTQAAIVELLRDILDDNAPPALYVSHDLRVVREIAGRVAVMKDGAIVETGATQTVLTQPAHAYTRALLASQPSMSRREPKPLEAPSEERQPVLTASGLRVSLGAPRHRTPILNDVSLRLSSSQTIAIVGESGAGKTTFGRALIGLLEPDGGELTLEGRPLAYKLRRRARRDLAHLQMVFQSSATSLNPSRSVERIVERAARRLGRVQSGKSPDRVGELLAQVHLPDRYRQRRPSQLSGGERQRVAIARALAAHPSVIVLDEAVSALDVTVQGAILRLLESVQAEAGTAFLFISHDMAVVNAFADEVVVLYAGVVVEHGPTQEVIHGTHHPYTEVLVRSVPGGLPLAPHAIQRLEAPIDRTPQGCIFASRCPLYIGPICDEEPPPWRTFNGRHGLLCHYEEQQLAQRIAADRAQTQELVRQT